MLRFVAPENTITLSQQLLPGAYLVGPDSVPIAGEVVVEDGLIRCEKGTRESASLALQIDLDVERLRQLNQTQPVICRSFRCFHHPTTSTGHLYICR